MATPIERAVGEASGMEFADRDQVEDAFQAEPFEDVVGLLELPRDEPDERVLPLLTLIEASEQYTAIFHGEMPHDGGRLYRIEVDD